MLSREQLQQAAADSGFQVESYEKIHSPSDRASNRRFGRSLAAWASLSSGPRRSTREASGV